MSGQPVNKPLDAERFRKEYLKSLQQEIQNNDKNLKANQLFIKTGTPQQPLDTRSVEERLQDKEALKPEIRSQLLALMDGGEAEKVVQNASDLQLNTIINALPFLITTLKPKFQMGMFADAFLSYVDRYAESEKRNTIDSEQMLMKDDVIPFLEAINRMTIISTPMKTALNASFRDLKELLPSIDELDNLNNEEDAFIRKVNLDKIDMAYMNIPRKQDFDFELEDIINREQNGDIRGFNDGLKRLGQMLDGAVVSAQSFPEIMTAQAVSEYIPLEDLEKTLRPELQVYIRKIWKKGGKNIGVPNPIKNTKREMIDALRQIDPIVRQQFGEPAGNVSAATAMPVPEGSGINRRCGRGLRTKPARTTELKNTDIDWNSGVLVPKVPRYLPLGKFVIHKDKLKENILSIKTPSGQGLPEFKMIRVNDKIGGAIRTILSGKQLTYDQIGELDEAEKKYLFNLATKSGLGERLNVPAPDKKKDEQDINKFEVMKGQIMAGNDSELLMKDFKKMIVKLREKDLLPKRQASDMLLELAREGY